MSACAYCGQPTHARTQRAGDGRPAHLECTGLHAPSRSVSGLATADDEAQSKAGEARLAAVELCEHGRARPPVWDASLTIVETPRKPPQRPLHTIRPGPPDCYTVLPADRLLGPITATDSEPPP